MSGRVIPNNIGENFNLELLAIEVQFQNIKFNIINLYAPQGFDINQAKHFFDSLTLPTFIFGDFNLHHTLWGASRSSALSNDFVDWLTYSHFIILNTTIPTHSTLRTQSILDLTLCSLNIHNQTSCYVMDSTFDSDHNPIVISWSVIENVSRNLKTINWTKITQQTREYFNNSNQCSIEGITVNATKIITQNTSFKLLSQKSYPPWWNLSCHNYKKLSKYFRKKAIKNISETDWIKHKEFASRFRFHFKKAKREYWEKVCTISRNPKMFFKILNKLSNHTNPNSKHNNIIIQNNRYICDPAHQSELFAKTFSTQNANTEPIPLDFSGINSFLNSKFEIWELKKAIHKTKNSTPGADNIPAIWFKNLNNDQLQIILKILQHQFDSADIPKQWKHALIIPIPKPNKDKTQVSSYRPIALTSVFCKVFERILTQRITYYLTCNEKLHNSLHGFIPFRDNQTAIYNIQTKITEAHEQKKKNTSLV